MGVKRAAKYKSLCDETNVKSLKEDIRRHVVSTLGNDYDPPRKYALYKGLAYSVRDRLVDRWIQTQRSYYDASSKRVYYLSMEFLPGRHLMNNLINLNMEDQYREAVREFGFELEDLAELEWEPGLGNGGLGRLASCYLDSMAAMRIPGHGYGIRYDYGIFYQNIVDGHQLEQCDNWLRDGNPWEYERPQSLYEVQFYGRTESYHDETGRLRFRWVDTESVMAMACDTLIPGYGNDNVINMRLWTAKSSREFKLDFFNRGDYVGAVHDRVISENISKILYPNDMVQGGRELRLRQQHFFVSATIQDIMRRFKKDHKAFTDFPNTVALQMNDTHPAIAVPELMRVLMDNEGLPWEEAWDITSHSIAYTNHTLLPEALETWPLDMFGRVLPRHLEIIFEINRRFLEVVAKKFPGNMEMLSKLSLIQEEPERRVRMAHLAIVGSHSVNGVSELHSTLLKTKVFKEFEELYPGRFMNITNGITPRRWLRKANPRLSKLISDTIGPGWITGLHKLEELLPHAENKKFRAAWQAVKQLNKRDLTAFILEKTGVAVDEYSLFDVHVKRIHEYKRQILNILHVITLYNRIRQNPSTDMVPRTVIFGGKAAPSYRMAKLIIRLITAVADRVNNDPIVGKRLKVVFLPNYCVSLAEKIIPGSDLSEQISTAGTEASGTGNMKFALNDALIIGTLDGANIEIMEEVERDNIFIFGLKAEEVAALKSFGYNPYQYYENDPELKRAIDMIGDGFFAPEEPGIFTPLRESVLNGGDHYMILADYRDYVRTQEEVSRIFRTTDEWTRRCIRNTAKMGMFSSDRAILEYAIKIWDLPPLF